MKNLIISYCIMSLFIINQYSCFQCRKEVGCLNEYKGHIYISSVSDQGNINESSFLERKLLIFEDELAIIEKEKDFIVKNKENKPKIVRRIPYGSIILNFHNRNRIGLLGNFDKGLAQNIMKSMKGFKESLYLCVTMKYNDFTAIGIKNSKRLSVFSVCLESKIIAFQVRDLISRKVDYYQVLEVANTNSSFNSIKAPPKNCVIFKPEPEKVKSDSKDQEKEKSQPNEDKKTANLVQVFAKCSVSYNNLVAVEQIEKNNKKIDNNNVDPKDYFYKEYPLTNQQNEGTFCKYIPNLTKVQINKIKNWSKSLKPTPRDHQCFFCKGSSNSDFVFCNSDKLGNIETDENINKTWGQRLENEILSFLLKNKYMKIINDILEVGDKDINCNNKNIQSIKIKMNFTDQLAKDDCEILKADEDPVSLSNFDIRSKDYKMNMINEEIKHVIKILTGALENNKTIANKPEFIEKVSSCLKIK